MDPDTGNWREMIKFTHRSLTEDDKGKILAEYSKWGRIGEAAAVAGVSSGVLKNEMKRDPDFAEAMLLAEEAYRDKLIGHHQNLVFNGTIKETYDRNGVLVGKETIYPIRLIEMELKKHDAGYRERQEVDIKVSGGVLVAPAEVKSIEDWENRFSTMKDVTPLPSGLPDKE